LKASWATDQQQGIANVVMVDREQRLGKTRLRIDLFVQRFQIFGLIETNEDRFLIIKEKKLTGYLAQIA
jgi:hypothetical protein